MRRIQWLVAVGLVLLATPGLGAEEGDAASFLATARAAHADLTTRGLTSLAIRVTLRRSEAESMRNYKDLAGFGYTWTAPAEEAFDFSSTHESLHKPLRDACRGLYREVTGCLFFDLLGAAKDLAMQEDEATVLLGGSTEAVGPMRAAFRKPGLELAAVAFPRARTTFQYGHTPTPHGHRVAEREAVVGDAAPIHTEYRVVRVVNGFLLPTVVELRTEKNATEFGLQYDAINGEPAVRTDPTSDDVQELVQAFEKAWRSWDDDRKLTEIRALAELRDDRASAAIAKLGLKDAEARVRREAAETLGVMARPNAVAALLLALKKSDDEIDVYLAVIRALGEIGDPRAVDALSKDWWNQRIGENGIAAARAKISALGKIRHVKAVDALIETFFMAREDSLSRLHADLVLALEKLTGETFGNNPKAWREWWKRSRTRFRFE